MALTLRETTPEQRAEDLRLFAGQEGEVLARRWALFGPILAFFFLLTEVPPYFTPEFPHGWALTLPMMAVMLGMGLLGRQRAPRAVVGWGSVVTAALSAAYVGTACAETGYFLSPHAMGLSVLMVMVPAVVSLDLVQSLFSTVASVAAWILAVRYWPADGAFHWDGLLTSLTYLSFLGSISVVSVAANRALRRNAFLSRREVERVHRFAVEDVLYRHLPPGYVERVLSGSANLEAPPERRTLTVLFADLVGFTALSEQMPGEALGALMARFYDLASEVAFAHGATVDKFIGDAAMVMLGAPEAMPPDEQARRAVAVARGLHAAIGRLGGPAGRPLTLRIGIHQDVCAVGTFGGRRRSDYTALGRGVNLAARLEQRCRPGETLVSEPVARWVEADRVAPLGEVELKGLAQPVSCFVVDPVARHHDAAS